MVLSPQCWDPWIKILPSENQALHFGVRSQIRASLRWLSAFTVVTIYENAFWCTWCTSIWQMRGRWITWPDRYCLPLSQALLRLKIQSGQHIWPWGGWENQSEERLVLLVTPGLTCRAWSCAWPSSPAHQIGVLAVFVQGQVINHISHFLLHLGLSRRSVLFCLYYAVTPSCTGLTWPSDWANQVFSPINQYPSCTSLMSYILMVVESRKGPPKKS
jgi:hypothetical protein